MFQAFGYPKQCLFLTDNGVDRAAPAAMSTFVHRKAKARFDQVTHVTGTECSPGPIDIQRLLPSDKLAKQTAVVLNLTIIPRHSTLESGARWIVDPARPCG